MFTRKTLLIAALACGFIGVLLFAAFHYGPFAARVSAFDRDLSRPDAVIVSENLAQLPADLLKAPVLGTLLSPEFADYYERHEARLSLSGTFRRLAYERGLTLPDRLVSLALSEAGEVALWQDPAGRLTRFALIIRRNFVGALLTQLARLQDDTQLEKAGRLSGTNDDILILRHGAGYALVLIAHDDRLVALSDPGLLFADTPAGKTPVQSATAAAVVKSWLLGEARPSAFFQLPGPSALPAQPHHTLAFSARAFSFGYEAFADKLPALAFSFDGNIWQGAAQTRGSLAPAPWDALPLGAAFCASLPVDWHTFFSLLLKADWSDQAANAFLAQFSGAAACWLPDSRLYAPVFAARLTTPADGAKAQTLFYLARRTSQADEAKQSSSFKEGHGLWQAKIASRFGEKSDDSGKRFLRPTLAVTGNAVLFSPDAKAVELAQAAAQKTYPALTEKLAEPDQTVAVLDPAALTRLAKREIFAALPAEEEATFLNAAKAHLIPQLERFAQTPPQAIRLGPETANGWHPLYWEPLKK
ncbi:MAG: DUF2138 family protein [Zoogloeaceae bacterium]|jgi:uncharacterized protein YfaA (DUF2138 family)|nr:DUF2138 family protein [Zoogloeaceae bacterium]